MRFLLALVSVALILNAAPALAGGKKKSGAKQSVTAAKQNSPAEQLVIGLITAAERAIIDSYVDRNHAHPPPEFAGAKPLPPGIQRKIARGGALPPGIAKRYMPGDLLAQLPKRPGQEWILAGTDLVIVEVATRIIVDVLKDAVRSG
jgi:hypothetical protein